MDDAVAMPVPLGRRFGPACRQRAARPPRAALAPVPAASGAGFPCRAFTPAPALVLIANSLPRALRAINRASLPAGAKLQIRMPRIRKSRPQAHLKHPVPMRILSPVFDSDSTTLSDRQHQSYARIRGTVARICLPCHPHIHLRPSCCILATMPQKRRTSAIRALSDICVARPVHGIARALGRGKRRLGAGVWPQASVAACPFSTPSPSSQPRAAKPQSDSRNFSPRSAP